MSSRVISTYEDLQTIRGQVLQPGRWLEITTEHSRLHNTACATQPFLVSENGPTPTLPPASATGAMLLSLLSLLRTTIEGVRFAYVCRMNIFYGFNDVRFFEPLPLPVKVRLHLRVKDATLLEGAVIHVVYGHRLETLEHHTVLAADVVNRIYLT